MTLKNEVTPGFREKLRNKSIDLEINKIKTDFKNALEVDDKNEFLKILKNLKLICVNYNFNQLASRIDDWEELIKEANNLTELEINYNDIIRILNTMIEETTKIINSPTKLNSSQVLVHPRKSDDMSVQISKTRSSASPMPSKRAFGPSAKINPILSQVAFSKNDEDLVYQELKPIKFEGLLRKDYTPEELSDEIRKILQEENVLSTPSSKIGSSSIRGARSNLYTENAYPFKQDCYKFNCNIL